MTNGMKSILKLEELGQFLLSIAWLYNFFHHKLVAITILFFGFWFNILLLALAGVILFGHSAMDRIFGYGLKFSDNFKHTHLGYMEKKAE